MTRPIRTDRWRGGCLTVLGLAEVLMATSAPAAPLVVGLVGGLALVALPWLVVRYRSLAGALLVLGVVPFAVLTYWAVVPVVLALLAALIATPLVLRPSAGTAPSSGAARVPSRRSLTP